uniref:Venom cystatin 10 n=1 Tax=Oncocephalus sp. TaxID=2944721 RepID=A0AB38ZEW2_9HEMI
MLKFASIVLVFSSVVLLNFSKAAELKKLLAQCDCENNPLGVKNAVCLGCAETIVTSDDKELWKTLKMVLEKRNAGVSIDKIINAKYRIVHGYKYTVEFEAKVNGSNEKKICHAIYVSKPWKNQLDIFTLHCS